ncbi:tetratricopeptide repeat protein [Microbulbifer marinus]|uniref:Tfp pilus assembly protein PilF n=1 Tax=Microbulbifer marinus TaxID=658218 RepID=A0A1H3XH54_9GAMM|nr:tetratricopeptide repeat protein [Microbulbifer marinus]SDZ98679.1 Tfp pilus assembly protein PilF [Microbulbifer marinus]
MSLMSMQKIMQRLAVLSLGLLLASCASTPTSGGRVSDYSSVRVSGSVNRDFERSLEYLRNENFPAAIELLLSVVEREKRLPAPYINLGIAYYKSGNEKNAEEAFLHALELDPQHPVATNELAVLYRKQGRFAEARKLYVNSLAKNPDYLPLIKNLGILCDLYLQDLQCALAQFQQYLSLDPEDKEVSIWLADLKRRAGK